MAPYNEEFVMSSHIFQLNYISDGVNRLLKDIDKMF